ncbi:DDE-type integrase/transposase/recombinase [Patescibacteria group bacterium]|nr:DDE-type integrase/transposase/recombinase [Patescibacteria group bacterium]MBU1034546.1 DDE-type integrase/transposase/recombinase [Patescibacteria group bacterium]MBU1629551.1 DDE-type integrase/transposase/recombinase [Patescibacteria group bacterium]MBU1907556.1 DDE-type integrase/transposase/recombinase [Patescibacteria group bacterium]
MVTEEAKNRIRILEHWKKYGIASAMDAFKLSERTLRLWKSVLKKGNGRLEALNPKKTTPHNRRKRIWPPAIVSEIKRLRQEHPNLGKDKIHPLPQRFCDGQGLHGPSIATIGNIMKDMGGLRTFPQKVRHNGRIVPRKRLKVPRKPKHFIATHTGHCVSLDTVERIQHGLRRYLITFVDIHSRFAFAMLTTSHASHAAKTFFDIIRIVFPYPIEFVLTDNGSEFMKLFDDELRRLCLTHWRTYPKTPKMNAHCERFNRTIQEEFVDYHAPLLMDVNRFNDKLLDWLVWYNAERPHYAHDQRSPLQFLLNESPEGCKRYLAHTKG